MDSLISIIVPVYNVEKYLERCVKSLVNQTYKNIEIVLVDDGSPDHSPQMCDRYAAEYENITVFHKKNGGLGDARNYGVQRCKADWVIFVDSDDYVEPKYVEDLVRLKEAFHADMSMTKFVRENEDGTKKLTKKDFKSYVTGKANALFQTYTGMDAGVAARGKLYPKWVLLKYPFSDMYHEDLAVLYKIIDSLDTFAIGCHKENYHYVARDGSILRSKLDERHLKIFDICKEFEDFILEKYQDIAIVIPLVYKRAVVEMLSVQKMDWKTYKSVFMKYRHMFRKYLGKVLADRRIHGYDKVMFLLLCGRPEVLYAYKKLVELQ